MPALPNPRHERFAQALAKGKPAGRAYEAAGYDAEGETADQCASRLLSTNAKVRERVEELKGKIADKAVLDQAWVLDRVMRNARICLGEEEVTITKDGEDTPIKRHDPAGANKALELLGREVNLFTEKSETTVTMKHEDRVSRRREAIERAKQRRNDGDSAIH